MPKSFLDAMNLSQRGNGPVILLPDGAVTLADTTSVQTFTNKTLTAPTISGSIAGDMKVLAASVTYDANVVAADITGFSWTVVAGATYMFDSELFTTQTTVGGLTVSFKLTTATLTSIRYASYQATAVDNTTGISSTGTTTTDATKIIDNKTAAFIRARVYGSFVVNAGGTFSLQACQNTSATGGDVSLILIGSTARMTRTL